MIKRSNLYFIMYFIFGIIIPLIIITISFLGYLNDDLALILASFFFFGSLVILVNSKEDKNE